MLYQPRFFHAKTGKHLRTGGMRSACELPPCNRDYGLIIDGRRYHAIRELGQHSPVLSRGRLVAVVDYAVTLG